jgi:hypothetical protein
LLEPCVAVRGWSWRVRVEAWGLIALQFLERRDRVRESLPLIGSESADLSHTGR